MGSFHRSCFLTQLPITDGDPIVGVFLLHRATPSCLARPIYPTSFWAPVSLPLTGSYNGYGWMDVDSTEANRVAIAAFNHALSAAARLLVHDKEGNTPGKVEVPYGTGARGIQDIYDLVHDQDIFVPSPTRFHADGRATLSVGLCHAEAWRFLLETPVQEWGEEDTTPDTLVGDADAVLDLALAAAARKSFPSEEDLPGFWSILARNNIRDSGLRAGVLSLLMPLANAAVAGHEGQADRAMSIVRGLANVLVVNQHMDALHRAWAPGIGASQDEEWALIARFQDMVADLANQACDAYGLEDEEDDA